MTIINTLVASYIKKRIIDLSACSVCVYIIYSMYYISLDIGVNTDTINLGKMSNCRKEVCMTQKYVTVGCGIRQ